MPSQNPYASPLDDAPATPARVSRKLPLASQGKRFLNSLLDGLLFGVIYGVVFFIGLLASRPSLRELEQTTSSPLTTILGYVAVLAFYIFMEGLFQKTPAKFLTGTRVVSAKGGKPSFGQIVGRSFARFIPFEFVSFFGGKGYPVGWHDSLSGTRVVTDR